MHFEMGLYYAFGRSRRAAAMRRVRGIPPERADARRRGQESASATGSWCVTLPVRRHAPARGMRRGRSVPRDGRCLVAMPRLH